MKTVEIYTDGACSGNPGKGGYCAILRYNDKERVIKGSEIETTNNRMELMAVIEGLKGLNQPCNVSLYSDSQYVVDAFNQGWLESWQFNDWKTSAKKEVKNVDLWKMLLELTTIHNVSFIKVKGHADNEHNNRCDKIAVEEYKNL